jgi:hypothetical protein
MTRGSGKMLLAIQVILLALFNIFIFSLFEVSNPKFWPAYFLTTAAIVLSSGSVSYCAAKKNLTLKDVFFNWPLVYVSFAYAVIQVIFAFAALSADALGATAANLTQAAFLALYAILAISAMSGSNIVEEIDEKQKTQTSFIKNLASDMEPLVRRATNPETRDKLQKLSDAARYSDPVSHESLAALENEISDKARELARLFSSGGDVSALCEEMILLLGDRNGKAKILK